MSNYKLKYYFGVILSIPLLPIIYFQGKSIRKKTPILPEAKEPKGLIDNSFSNTLQILTIGESTFAGVGVDTHKNGFTGALATQLSKDFKSNIYWQVYAKSGYTAKLITEKLIPKIKKQAVDIIVIGLGGNDAFKLNSPNKWKIDINNLINTLQKKFPNTPIYFTNMPPVKEFPGFTKTIKFVVGNLVEILGSKLKLIVKDRKNVFFNDEIITLKTWSKKYLLAKKNSNIYFSDGIHPSKLTYKVWGIEMGKFIIKNDSRRNYKTF